MDTSRAVFEKFVTEEAIKRNYQFMDNLLSKFGDEYSVTWVDMAWMGWQASREAIEIELPELCGDGENDNEYTEGLNDGISQCGGAIASHGIRIKGKTE